MKIYCATFFLLCICCTNTQQKNIEPIKDSPQEKYKPKYIADYMDSLKQKKSYEKSRFYYDKDGNAVVEAIFINTKDGRKRMAIAKEWKGGGGYIGNREIEYYSTKKQLDDAQRKMKQRQQDTIFAEIEKVVLQIAIEYDYDFEKAYGIEAKYRNPNIKKAVCDGYANTVVETLSSHYLVDRVEKWTSSVGKHAWNVIVLKDGRKIYCDATWYDGNSIDNEGYVVNVPNRNPVNLTFDIEEFNTLGEAIDRSSGEILKVHFAWEDNKLEN